MNGIHARISVHVLQLQPRTEREQTFFYLGSFFRGKPAAVHDDICHVELRKMPNTVFTRKASELVVQLVMEGGPDAAESMDRLLPVRHRMQHVIRMVSLGRRN